MIISHTELEAAARDGCMRMSRYKVCRANSHGVLQTLDSMGPGI